MAFSRRQHIFHAVSTKIQIKNCRTIPIGKKEHEGYNFAGQISQVFRYF